MIDKHLDFARLCHPERSAVRRAVEGSREGFTLVELLVYIAIVGIVVIVAGQAFSNSTKMRVRTQSMLKASEVAENVGALLKEDIAQMGAKSAIDAANSTAEADAFLLKDKVYIDPNYSTSKDYSSFNLEKAKFGTGRDRLTIRRINYNATGGYVRTEEVAWYVKENGVLYRSCKSVDGTADADCSANGVEVEIADGVEKFSVLPSKPGVLEGATALFPNYSDAAQKNFRFIAYENSGEFFLQATSSPVEGGDIVVLSNMTTNYTSDGSAPSNPVKHMFLLAKKVSSPEAATTAWNDCEKFVFHKDVYYEIAFRLTDVDYTSRMFRPGIDHFAVGIREASGSAPIMVPDVPDFLVYPPAHSNDPGSRVVSFMTHGIANSNGEKIDVTACLAFSVSLFSLTIPPISLSDISIREINDGNYKFEETYTTPLAVDKKNVKALRIDVNVKKNGEGGDLRFVVPVPSNGV